MLNVYFYNQSWSSLAVSLLSCQMMLCVNTDLAMGKGKMAAQCCHAAVGCYQRASRSCPNAVKYWERTGCAKICVKCPAKDDGQALVELAQLAHALDVPFYLVEDAGRTQIAAGSRTVLGLGPAPTHVMDQITSHLKLM
jgi:PTH2 family peptidyl-tRNA hydrolase